MLEKMLSRLRFLPKIFLLGVILIVCFMLVLAWLYIDIRDSKYQAKEIQSQHLVETTSSILEHYYKQVQTGAMSEAEAKHTALEDIKFLRYDVDNYFWINDEQPRMIMHPIQPELDNQDLSDWQDPTGKRLFVEAVNVCKRAGAGPIEYQWPKPGAVTPSPKISYVKLFQPWGWIVGTGVYVDDVEVEIANLVRSAFIVVAGMVVGGLAISYVLARSIARPMRKITEAAQSMAAGDLNQNIEYQAKDELGDMAAAFQRMVAYLQQMAQAARRLAQGDVTAQVTPQSEHDVLGLAFSQMITYQQHMAAAAGRLAGGDVTIAVSPQSDKDMLGTAFSHMVAYQQHMADTATRLAGGDLTSAVSPQSDQDRLGHAFAQMAANLRALIGQVQQSAEQVANASQQLNASSDQAGQAAQQVANTIQQIAQGTTQQAQAVAQTSHSIAQTAHAAEGIAQGSQDQAKGVQETSNLIGDMAALVEQVGQVAASVTSANGKVTQAARHGASSVEQTGQGMTTIRERTTEAAAKVKDLSSRSKEIGRIIQTIDDIADKTDMLALNAAVEAARAGEHGRGFAVVADQVRKLSEDSKNSTRDIADLIERVQETITETIAAIQAAAAEVNTGSRLAGDTSQSLLAILQAAEEANILAGQIDQAMQQLKQKSEGVVTAIESVSAVVEENTAAAEEMAANSQEVTSAMENIAGIAEENSASTEEVSASAEEMSAQIEEVVASAEELSALAEELRHAASQFKL